jgi:hypothetical protein
MNASDCVGHDLTSRDRIEKVQGQEEIGTAVCIDGKICMDYCITVEIPAFGIQHGRMERLEWLSEMLKVIPQIQARECHAFIHLVISCSISKHMRQIIESKVWR